VYQGAASPPESLDLHFIPFKQGSLYVGSTKPLDEEEIQMVKSLAEAFSIAYARYEDFTQLEHAKNQIEQALSELRSTQTQLIHAEKMASLGELTAGIAHEIQNPLNFVNNFSEVSKELIEELKEERAKQVGERDEALEEEIVDDIIHNLEKINHHGQRASSIVKGMLEHSRSEKSEKELMDINKLADEYIRLAYHGYRAKDKSFNADFRTELDSTLPKVKIIGQDIGRVLLNLINNAFYAASKRSQIELDGFKPEVVLKTKKTDKMVEITVKDNGEGIPDKVIDKIFQPFFTTKPTGQGTGLGLSLSYDIITKGHDGLMEVDTHEGIGTEFTIQLPIA
jgi:signal transduction histidine kinase